MKYQKSGVKRLKTAYHRLIVPISWVLVSLIMSFLLAKHIAPVDEIEHRLFGLRTIHHYSFNYSLFFITLVTSLSFLILGLLLRRINGFRKFTDQMARTVLQNPWLIFGLTLTSLGFFVLGLTRPLFISEQFFIVEREVSLLNSIRMMFQNDEFFLGSIILIFTLVFPIFKYLLLLFSVILNDRENLHSFNVLITLISKWSMLDVFIVALLLLNMKFDSRIVNMELKSGVVWFSLSIILIMLAMLLQGRRGKKF